MRFRKQAVVRADLGLALRADRRGHRGGARHHLLIVGLQRGQLTGRVAELRLRGRDLLLQQLDLLLRLGEHRLQLLVVAIERGGTLLILLRLHGDRLLLLGRERDGGRLRTARGRTAHLAAAGGSNEQHQCRQRGGRPTERRIKHGDESCRDTNSLVTSKRGTTECPPSVVKSGRKVAVGRTTRQDRLRHESLARLVPRKCWLRLAA